MSTNAPLPLSGRIYKVSAKKKKKKKKKKGK
jgi:hypothetical protein